MKFQFKEFCGKRYLVPEGFEFVTMPISVYPSFCGAGSGIGDDIVPEHIGGMRVSHICHVHDESWDKAENNFFDFMIGNLVFGFNLFVYLSSCHSGYWKSKWKAFKGMAYFVAVSTVGWKIFKNIKG